MYSFLNYIGLPDENTTKLLVEDLMCIQGQFDISGSGEHNKGIVSYGLESMHVKNRNHPWEGVQIFLTEIKVPALA